MRKKLDENEKRVPVQVMVFPYIKALLEEKAAKLTRGSVSSVAEEIITVGLGAELRKLHRADGKGKAKQ